MMNIWMKRGLFAALGAGAGFAYYTFIGCASGTCPITSNPYISTAYGAAVGILLTVGKTPTTPPQ
jgi:hypothetical protein